MTQRQYLRAAFTWITDEEFSKWETRLPSEAVGCYTAMSNFAERKGIQFMQWVSINFTTSGAFIRKDRGDNEIYLIYDPIHPKQYPQKKGYTGEELYKIWDHEDEVTEKDNS